MALSFSLRWSLFSALTVAASILLFYSFQIFQDPSLLIAGEGERTSTSIEQDWNPPGRPDYSGQQAILAAPPKMQYTDVSWTSWFGTVFKVVLSSPLAVLHATQTSTVQLSYGAYQGVNLPGGVTQFLGVRYANTPQRFSASGPPTSFAGVSPATKYGSGCQGTGSLSSSNSEDCLFADIYVPTSAIQSFSTAKLPVYVFVQGGGLSNTLGRFNGTGLIQAGNMGLITVAFTYRAGPFGFLASKEVQAGGTLNIGLLDQVQLLQWVRKEISSFGGDPGHVILGGQSAGAGCIMSHLTAYGGRNPMLYQAALVQSPSSPPIRTVAGQQYQYDQLVNNTGCTGSPDTLACLRNLSTNQILQNAAITPYPGGSGTPVFGWHIVLDGTYVQDLPHTSFANGKYNKVPILIGDVSDEGTIFTPNSISSASQAQGFIKNNFPSVTDAQLSQYSSMYGLDSNSTNYWSAAATSYGETRYICPGIHVSQSAPTWNFRYNIATDSQIKARQGAAHSSDLAAVFAPTYGSSDQVNLLQGAAGQTLQWLQGYWTSFIKTYDPNAQRAVGSPQWSPWAGGSRMVFNIANSGIELVPQDQLQRCAYISSIAGSLEH